MGKFIDRTTNFYLDIFTKRNVADIIQKIQYWKRSQTLYEKEMDKLSDTPSHRVYSFALVPDYLEISIESPNKYAIKTGRQNNLGYAIALEDKFVLDSFLKSQFKSNYRNLKKRHLRLESCFNITYKMFYGDLGRDEYQYLMTCLRSMLVRRFSQKNDQNESLTEWEEIMANTFGQVNLKEASIFVIYSNDIPIDISINYHFQKIMYGAVSSYDIDYHKFGLGSIEKVKLLEWCVANDYKILEFAYGDLDYKNTWSNCTYKFKYQVVYFKQSLWALIMGNIELLRLYIKEYLKSKKVDVIYRKMKVKSGGERSNKMSKTDIIEFDRSFVPDINKFGRLKELDEEGIVPLKMTINDFVYATQEHIDHIKIYKVLEAPHTYLISGEKNIQKITAST